MNRQNQILAVVLAIQLVLVAVVFWPRPAASVAGGASLFEGLEADQIVKLTVSDATGQQIQLTKGSDGWVLPEAGDYACQEDKVSGLLDKIAGLKADRLVTQTGASHKRLRVAAQDFERLVEFELADGRRHKLYLGTSPTYQATHVRAGNANEVYLASDLSIADVPVQASGWVDTLYLSIPQDQVTALSIENKNGRFEFEKDAEGKWTMEGLEDDETLNENNLNSLVSRLASLRMLQPLGKSEQDSYGLKEPGAVVTIQTRDESEAVKSYTLRLGAKSEEGEPGFDDSFVVISSESPYYVRVGSYSVQDFIEKGRDHFIQLPPTPTPEGTPTP